MTTQQVATLSLDFDGGLNVLVGNGVEIAIPASFFFQNGLFVDLDVVEDDADTAAEIVEKLLERKGFGFDRSRLFAIVHRLCLPGAPLFDPADFDLALEA